MVKEKKNFNGFKVLSLNNVFDDPFLNLVYDTIKQGKQCLVFVNTKQRSERTAEVIAKKMGFETETTRKLSDEVLKALPKPTKQCERLSKVIKKGIAFHHSGLVAKQRRIVEDYFRKGDIKVICCTPTLAYGLNLPAFRVIVRDLKRFGYRGYSWIPVLEVQQMFGRAGRPKYDKEGQAICIAETEAEGDAIIEHYLLGRPEAIYSKLAVEPVFRTYLLSLVVTKIVDSREELLNFFKKTFWAFQYKDESKIKRLINSTIKKLINWGFLVEDNEESISNKNINENDVINDFVSADLINNKDKVSNASNRLKATKLGRRVAELYLDPLTAHQIILGLRSNKKKTVFSIIHLCTQTLELRPYLNVKVREYDEVEEKLASFQDEILTEIPKPYDEEYDDFLNAFKTALLFYEWINEKDDEFLMEKYSVRPGELRTKLTNLDWLVYATHEIAVLIGKKDLLTLINKTRLRLKYGVKEELLPLLKLEGIGRIKARKLFNNKIKTIRDVKRADLKTVSMIVGEKTALKIKKQLGDKVSNVSDEVKLGDKVGDDKEENTKENDNSNLKKWF